VRDAVFFSSTAAVWSQSGAGHYAAANCALDALAARRQAAGLPATALQLGPFRDVGMAAAHAGALAALGLGSLWPREVRLTLTLYVRGWPLCCAPRGVIRRPAALHACSDACDAPGTSPYALKARQVVPRHAARHSQAPPAGQLQAWQAARRRSADARQSRGLAARARRRARPRRPRAPRRRCCMRGWTCRASAASTRRAGAGRCWTGWPAWTRRRPPPRHPPSCPGAPSTGAPARARRRRAPAGARRRRRRMRARRWPMWRPSCAGSRRPCWALRPLKVRPEAGKARSLACGWVQWARRCATMAGIGL